MRGQGERGKDVFNYYVLPELHLLVVCRLLVVLVGALGVGTLWGAHVVTCTTTSLLGETQK